MHLDKKKATSSKTRRIESENKLTDLKNKGAQIRENSTFFIT